MSWKSNFPDGIVLNCEHDGLLTIAEERLISIIKKEPISNVYHVEQTPFARGKFAAVRKCTHQQTGVEYAAKFIRKRRRAMDQRQDIVHEMAVLQLAADCPFIVSLHEVFETSAEVALVLELAAGGELQTVLDVQEGLRESEAILVMRQIIEGLGFLHDRNIAHLDLKPQNLLLTGTYPECDIKLCDFGISRVIQGGVEVREILGTPDYVAPEILSYEPISLATDIWSVGVLAYVLLSGFSPFGGDTKQETFLNISQCSLTFPSELFEGVSALAKDFIRATLQTEPKKRLTSRQCLHHPWLNRATEPRCITVEAHSIGRTVDCGEAHTVDRLAAHTVVPCCVTKEAHSVDHLKVHSCEQGEGDTVDRIEAHTVDCLEAHTCDHEEGEPVNCIEVHTVNCGEVNNVPSCIRKEAHTGDRLEAHTVDCREAYNVPRCITKEAHTGDRLEEHTVDCREAYNVPRCITKEVHTGDCVEKTETLPSTEKTLACATVNVQDSPCVEKVRVATVSVVSPLARSDLHSCRMGDDITKQYLRSLEDNGPTTDRDEINGLKISTVSLECVNEYKERRIVVEMSQDGQDRGGPESDEDLPLHKRPKNCEATCGFPRCRHLHADKIRHGSVAGANIDRPLLC